ncbi:hypothetical protein GCM10022226_57870 [Sphaerisporangium flaviroseum]|uniref:YbhB/YbcL family Raf kinase inhibitor-like protein n=1 Tax=Sphaerisporangium flaviroseum TaxID=509199 RepID=A0ABP7IXV0_9ACTN
MKIDKLGVVCGGLALVAALAGCSAGSASPAAGLKVSSPAFAEGAAIPEKYVCSAQGGQDISPPLAWSDVPESARELAIVVDDPDAPGGSYIHWIVTGIPASETSVSEGDPVGKVMPGSDGKPAYAGPCPPGGTHHYHFILYALRDPITPAGDAGAVHQHLKDTAITSATTIATWTAVRPS